MLDLIGTDAGGIQNFREDLDLFILDIRDKVDADALFKVDLKRVGNGSFLASVSSEIHGCQFIVKANMPTPGSAIQEMSAVFLRRVESIKARFEQRKKEVSPRKINN